MQEKIPKAINNTENLELTPDLPYFQELIDMGYRPVKVLRNSERFVGYEVSKDNNRFFFKGIVNQTIGTGLENEEWFSDCLNNDVEQSIARTPLIIRSGPTWYISEFLEGTPLCSEAECYKIDFTPHTAAICDVLIWIDSLKIPSQAPPSTEKTLNHTLKLSQGAVEAGVISQAIREKGLVLTADVFNSPELRVSHGDFSPWHIFSLTNQQYGIIDSEHASAMPRFSDLAFMYERLYNRCNAPDAAAQLLSIFLTRTDENHTTFFASFLPILTAKALEGCFYSSVDWVRHGYKPSSKALLEKCLKQDLSLLV